MDEIISYKMCAVKVRNAKLRNYLNTVLLDAIQRLENQCEMVKLCGKYRSCVRQTGQNCYLHNNWDFVKNYIYQLLLDFEYQY
jgi:hypothetical protein